MTTGQSGTSPRPFSLRPFFLIALTGLLLRALILLALSADSHLPLESIARGHDGAEYVQFATALAHGSLAQVPPEARTHYPGWPALLAPLVPTRHPALAGALLAYAILTFTVWRALQVLPQALPHVPPPAWTPWAAILLLSAYPSQLYYSLFALSESLFLALWLGSILAWLANRRPTAYLLCGLAACVRGPGLLLAPILALLDLSREGRRGREFLILAGLLALAALPYGIQSRLTRHAWGGTTFEVLRPHFGLSPAPWLRAIREVGPVRASYLALALAFFITSAVLLARSAHSSRWNDPARNILSLSTLIFLLFHLALQSLRYYGRDIPLLNYQDRYLIPILPACLLPWLSYPRNPRRALLSLTAATTASTILSLSWGHGYLRAYEKNPPRRAPQESQGSRNPDAN